MKCNKTNTTWFISGLATSLSPSANTVILTVRHDVECLYIFGIWYVWKEETHYSFTMVPNKHSSDVYFSSS